jgi:hypothetical protein
MFELILLDPVITLVRNRRPIFKLTEPQPAICLPFDAHRTTFSVGPLFETDSEQTRRAEDREKLVLFRRTVSRV